MLKISKSTESTIRPEKGGVGVGGDGVDNGGGHSSDFDRKFHPRLCTIAAPLTSMLRTRSSIDLSICAIQIAVERDEFDGGGGKLVKKLSKSRRIVKSLKNLKSLKSCKSYRFGRTFTEVPILCQRTRASVRALTVFRAPFAGLRNSLDTTFGAINVKAKANSVANTLSRFFLEKIVFFKLLYIKFLSAKCMSSLC